MQIWINREHVSASRDACYLKSRPETPHPAHAELLPATETNPDEYQRYDHLTFGLSLWLTLVVSVDRLSMSVQIHPCLIKLERPSGLWPGNTAVAYLS